ncbi:hypothetical protein [Mycolicibacterium austroafricanum]|uniref:hypothetical protein n=1 Tax=Mycolicibacterium austroafricanum TaxID=39687 RepID=UPI000A72AF37|nr:hypothetical protein [Mycolicibacterium austroafricanum]
MSAGLSTAFAPADEASILQLGSDSAGSISIAECREGGGDVEYNPGGNPRHCKGGIHDGKPLQYGD